MDGTIRLWNARTGESIGPREPGDQASIRLAIQAAIRQGRHKPGHYLSWADVTKRLLNPGAHPDTPCIRKVPGHRENDRADKQTGEPIPGTPPMTPIKVTNLGVASPRVSTKGFKKLSMKTTVAMQTVGSDAVLVQLALHSTAPTIWLEEGRALRVQTSGA